MVVIELVRGSISISRETLSAILYAGPLLHLAGRRILTSVLLYQGGS